MNQGRKEKLLSETNGLNKLQNDKREDIEKEGVKTWKNSSQRWVLEQMFKENLEKSAFTLEKIETEGVC